MNLAMRIFTSIAQISSLPAMFDSILTTFTEVIFTGREIHRIVSGGPEERPKSQTDLELAIIAAELKAKHHEDEIVM
jgi:hypothetical protein